MAEPKEDCELAVDPRRDALGNALEQGVITKKEYDKKLKKLYPVPKPVPSHEPFSWKKFRYGMFSLFDPVEWSQTFRELGITDVRKWIIVAMILGALYGWGYMKGVGNTAVSFDLRGQEAHIALNEHVLHILPDGTAQVEELDGTVLKKIRTKDIPELRKALKPIGFEMKPFFTAGYGASTKGGDAELGVGTSVFKFYKVHLDTFLTNHGIYAGVDYQLTNNFGALVGAGVGFEADQRIYFGGKWLF